MEYSQAQAAVLCRVDERSIRTMVDSGCLIPTAETAEGGRGKPKLFDEREVMIASIIAEISFPTPSWRKPVADWIRRSKIEFKQIMEQECPTYLLAEFDESSVYLKYAHSQKSSGLFENIDKVTIIPISIYDDGKFVRNIKSFIGVNINDAIWWAKISADDLKRLLPRQSASTSDDVLFELEDLLAGPNDVGGRLRS